MDKRHEHNTALSSNSHLLTGYQGAWQRCRAHRIALGIESLGLLSHNPGGIFLASPLAMGLCFFFLFDSSAYVESVLLVYLAWFVFA